MPEDAEKNSLSSELFIEMNEKFQSDKNLEFFTKITPVKKIPNFSDYISTLSHRKPNEFGKIETTELFSAVFSKMYNSGFWI